MIVRCMWSVETQKYLKRLHLKDHSRPIPALSINVNTSALKLKNMIFKPKHISYKQELMVPALVSQFPSLANEPTTC